LGSVLLINKGNNMQQFSHADLQRMVEVETRAAREVITKVQDNVRTRMEKKGFTEVLRYKAGRNEPCPCGSGKKFKHCHLNNQ
jgi:uncharacterized protein YecA (UPF0149 family)